MHILESLRGAWIMLFATLFAVATVSAQETLSQSYVDGSTEMHRFYSGGKWGYIDRRGVVLVKPRFEWAMDSSEGLAAVEDSDGTCGYIRRDGNWAAKLPPRAWQSGSFSEGRAWFKQKLGDETLWGCIASNGDIVVAPKYRNCKPFSEGLAVVGVNSGRSSSGSNETRYGYINRSGELVIPAKYRYASQFCKGRAFVASDDGQLKCIDREGKQVFTVAFPDDDRTLRVNVGPLLEERAAISLYRYQKGVGTTLLKRGVLTTNGRVIWVPKNRMLDNSFSEGLAAVLEEGTSADRARFRQRKFGFVDVEGRIVIHARFDAVGEFSEGLCRVLKDGVWQYIDRSGRVILKGRKGQEWNDAEDFYDGLARVHIGGALQGVTNLSAWWKGGCWYYINRKGQIVAKCREDGDEYIMPGFGEEYLKVDGLG